MKFNLYTNNNYCRVIKDIPKGCELITYYGDDYDKNLLPPRLFSSFQKAGTNSFPPGCLERHSTSVGS